MSFHTLYGAPLSLYTGRPRSYLIKSGESYKEKTPTTRHFLDTVVPKAGGRQGMPTLETATGEVIRDGAAIIDHFEALNNHTFKPRGAKQHVMSLLFDVLGAEGLMRPAMHYRWDFPEENLNFLTFHFESCIPGWLDKKSIAQKSMNKMRNAGQMFGAVPESFEVVEAHYLRLVDSLNEHFGEHPYLFGGKPCIGDFGLIAPFYGHLGRDPAPLSLMQSRAVRLFRWVERMNRPEPDTGEFELEPDDYLQGDEIPDSLIAVLKQFSTDFVPETLAAAETINAWLDAENPKFQAIAERGVGMAEFSVEGIGFKALAQPYRFYLLQRFHEAFDQLGKNDRDALATIFEAGGMTPVLQVRLTRQLGRLNNREVWL